ncbi:MAG: TraX family protein [Adlercreutzia sp.]|nr:TraX family protein [Adlercreutzia sp.]
MRLQCGAAVKGLPFPVFVYYSSMNRPAITSFTLKVVAIVGMTCNHVANIFALQLPGWITVALCSMGGLTFPIMAFLLCEGYRHTSDLRHYARRLALFALVAQVPYSLLWGATANVLVTLLMGLGILWADERLRNRLAFGALFVGVLAASLWCDWGVIGPLMIYLFHRLHDEGARKAVGLTVLTAVLALALPAASGIVTFLETGGATGAAHAALGEQDTNSTDASPADHFSQNETAQADNRTDQDVAATEGAEADQLLETQSPEEALVEALAAPPQGTNPVAYTVEDAGALVGNLGALGYATIGFGLAALLLISYNGQRGRPLKWFFYIYYPAHLMALWSLAQII